MILSGEKKLLLKADVKWVDVGHYPELSSMLHAATGRRDDGSEFVYKSTKTWFDKLNADRPVEPSSRYGRRTRVSPGFPTDPISLP